ncbi:MAG: hypothetical protein K2F63_02510, partial [Muribaculaceae bacterium]|nr:hypothetical protein [Muribaculaceae bacterium]
MPRGRKNITQADEEIIRRAQQADAPQPRRRSGRGAAGTAAVRRRRPFWLRAVRFASIALSILVVLVLIATAYAGYVSPLQRYGGYWGILP